MLPTADCLVPTCFIVVKVRINNALKVCRRLSQKALDNVGPGISRSQDKESEGAFGKSLKI